jgi:glucose/arabinose dehydrogenase
VSEFHATNGLVDSGSERQVLKMADPANNHNGGMLAFDAEGMLLIGTGDGGGAGDPHKNGQDVTQPLGKLLRIDVDGGNPYGLPVNDAEGRLGPDALPEIRATGLRNPWRYSVDRATGDVFIGDVGQGEWEEVDVLPAGVGGLNFGWSIMEGPACFGATECDQTGLTPPVASYSHSSGAGCTIIGGYVYRGAAFPALTGAYLVGDYCQGTIWALPAAEAVATGTAPVEQVASLDGQLVSFGQDDAGELYAVDLSGRILRLTAVSK